MYLTQIFVKIVKMIHSLVYQFFHLYFQPPMTGADPGGGPPKIGKNMIFLAYNRDFSHEIPQKISRLPPLGVIFLNAPP